MSESVRAVSPDDAWLPVFHGTRLSKAQAITASGFNPTPVVDLIAAVADAHGVAVESVNAHLAQKNRFVVLDHRPGAVYVCADPDRAGSWANQAPEAVWEALWSIWSLKHPELGDWYYQSTEGHFWVLAQQLADPPAIVKLEVPATALLKHPQGGDAANWLAKLADRHIEGSALTVADCFKMAPQWRADPAQARIAGYLEVPTRVDAEVGAFITGQAQSEFYAETREGGRWGEPMGRAAVGGWWSFHQIWSLLAPQRRAELEQIGGVHIEVRTCPIPCGLAA